MPSSTISRPPVRISKVAGRYLLFDIDDVMYLRRKYNICSVFVGTIPQNPQQNIFMGLPIELMPEEAQVLVDKKAAFVVDDGAFHPMRLAALDESARRRYLQAIKADGKKAQLAVIESKQSFKPKIKKGKAKSKSTQGEVLDEANTPEQGFEGDDGPDASLFSPSLPPSSGVSSPSPLKQTQKPEDVPGYAITPTTSNLLSLSSPSFPEQTTTVDVPPSYPLYAHLQDRGYYMMPGLRFGCDYNVYPGDPLRFHSHFQAASYAWDQEIAMLDLVAGGRLGTGVKKGYLIGGAVEPDSDGKTTRYGDGEEKGEGSVAEKGVDANPNAPPARAFCIEWAAM
ncbi:SEN34 subunit of tRNA-splicing endonuclease [Hypoxylon crocopeplum]|nr:SEN34 subunit of tRNA-splicing endonuclease [Hypoxylon crocopeplum]